MRAMPLKELKRELDDIEVQQLGLERQGVKLEQTIRLKLDEAPQLNGNQSNQKLFAVNTLNITNWTPNFYNFFPVFSLFL